LILAHPERLTTINCGVRIRIPVIPGFNDKSFFKGAVEKKKKVG
jgi:hypothetical protein